MKYTHYQITNTQLFWMRRAMECAIRTECECGCGLLGYVKAWEQVLTELPKVELPE